MTKSRVGQPYPIRTSPLPEQPSARTLRAIARSQRHSTSPRDSTTISLTSIPEVIDPMSTTVIERSLTTIEARTRAASQDPQNPPRRSPSPDEDLPDLDLPADQPPDVPGEPSGPPEPPGPPGPPGPPDPPGGDGDPEDNPPEDDPDDFEISNRDLARAILKLSSGKKESKKSHLKPKSPTVFSGGTNEQLRTFLYECELAFNTNTEDYSSDRQKIFYAISYLSGSASGFFQPFVLDYGNLPVNSQPAFLRKWDEFRKKLTQQFGSYSPEDDDEAQIFSIPFPENGKASDYFIKFGQYENRVQFGKRGLRFIARQALPPRLKTAVNESKMDKETWKDFKACVLKCDDDYWRTIEQDAAERKLLQSLQQRYRSQQSSVDYNRHSGTSRTHHSSAHHSPQVASQPHRSKPSGNPGNTHHQPRPPPPHQPAGPYRPAPPNPPPKPKPSHLGPDGRLTATERQRRMDNGLCLICAQKGHMASECPSARYKPSGTSGAPPRLPPKGRKAKADSKPVSPAPLVQVPVESK